MTQSVSADLTPRSQILFVIANLLAYPATTSFDTALSAAVDVAQNGTATDLLGAVEQLVRLPEIDRERLYVETFDFQERSSLYLTAHEYGDTRDRGQALVKLQQMLLRAGWEITSGELPDYIPLLFEFLAVEPEHPDADELMKRLATICLRLCGALAQENPYAKVLQAALAQLPAPSDPPTGRLEAPDLEDLPFPLFHD